MLQALYPVSANSAANSIPAALNVAVEYVPHADRQVIPPRQGCLHPLRERIP